MSNEQVLVQGAERDAHRPQRGLILIVDDDPTQRLLAREFLESDGYLVQEADDGEYGLQQARATKPDLIVLDVMMPGIDGFEVCRRIRSDADLMHTPVLVATGLDDETSIERAFDAGATEFMGKPMALPLLRYRARFMIRIGQVEKDLRKAMEMAQAATRAKSTFLANMNHELRTPLNAIIGFSEIMTRQLHAPLGHESYVDYSVKIHESGKFLLEIVQSVLDLAKVDAGSMELREDVVAIESVVQAAVQHVSPRARQAEIQINVSIEDQTARLWADGVRLRQILINLLSNAVKFTSKNGEVHVTVGWTQTGDVTFSVSDTGIGIAPEHISKITESFRQIDDRLARRYEGMGLGIPLALAMAKLHGGTLTFDSKLGHGTTATLTLPASRLLPPLDTRGDRISVT